MSTKAERQLEKLQELLSNMANNLKNDKVVSTIADASVKQIVKRTRAGYGITSNKVESASIVKLKNKPSTKKRRKFDKKKGVLSSKTTPAKANLTRTGDMLDNLEVKKLSNTEFVIEPNAEDQEKVNRLDESGKKFLGLAKKELKSILSDSFKGLEKIFTKINNV